MFRSLVVIALMPATLLLAEESQGFKLAAPASWGGETIKLPPGFARDMKLQGLEHIRFAPGMMKADSDSFFSYAFVFDLETKPVLTDTTIEAEFLKYYRGLCKAVLNGKLPDVDFSQFKLELQKDKQGRASEDSQNSPERMARYHGTLYWIEPFATQSAQRLNLEIWTWGKNERNFIFACVSPQQRDAAIWRELHKIRDDYVK